MAEREHRSLNRQIEFVLDQDIQAKLASEGSSVARAQRQTTTRTNAGYILWMDKNALAQIHDLVRNYRSSLGIGSYKDCELCSNVSATPGDQSNSKPKKTGKRQAEGG